MRFHVITWPILIAFTVAIHASGLVAFLRMFAAHLPFWRRHPSFVTTALTLSWVVATLAALHMAEIAVWASYFFLRGLFTDFETAIYYSLATYTTTGFGDVVLPKQWRVLGTTEALVGALMTAWSVAFLISVINTVYQESQAKLQGKPAEGQP